MAEDIRTLLHEAARPPGTAVDAAGLVSRARGRRARRRAGAGAAAVVALVAAIVGGQMLAGGVRFGGTPPASTPPAPVDGHAGTPDPTPTASERPSAGEEPALATVGAADLGARLVGVGGDGATVLRYDGAWRETPLDPPARGRIVFADDAGGVVYQGDFDADGDHTGIRRVPPGSAASVAVLPPPGTEGDGVWERRLVGTSHAGAGTRILFVEARGASPDAAEQHVLSATVDGADVRTLAAGFPTEGIVVEAAGRGGVVLAVVAAESGQRLVLLDGERRTTLLEAAPADRITGVDHGPGGLAAVAVVHGAGGTASGGAELVLIDLARPGEPPTRSPVPADAGTGTPGVRLAGVSVQEGAVVVNRWDGPAALPPLVYDIERSRWDVLERAGIFRFAP